MFPINWMLYKSCSFGGFHADNQSFDYTSLYWQAKLDDFRVARIETENYFSSVGDFFQISPTSPPE